MQTHSHEAAPFTPTNPDSVSSLSSWGESQVFFKEEREPEQEQVKALFGLELGAADFTQFRKSGPQAAAEREEHTDRDSVSGILRLMAPGWSLSSVYTGGGKEAFRWRLIGQAHGQQQADARDAAGDFSAGLRMLLDAARTGYHFTALQNHAAVAHAGRSLGSRVRAALPCVRFAPAGRRVGFQNAPSPSPQEEVLLSHIVPAPRSAFNHIAEFLANLPCPVSVSFTLTRVQLTSEQRTRIEAALRRLESGQLAPWRPGTAVMSAESVARITAHASEQLQAWLTTGLGASQALSISAAEPLPSSVVRTLAHELLPTEQPLRSHAPSHGEEPNPDSVLDLRDCMPGENLLPSLFPNPDDLNHRNLSAVYPCPALPEVTDGLHLGHSANGSNHAPVRLSGGDRARHLYVVGATGTGKSTLLANMIAQDIKAGHGVCVIDPHGDLVAQALSHVPEYRYDDLVLFNPGDMERAPGLNFLECDQENQQQQAHFLINELLQICHRLYHRETLGPVFETSLRTALLILMDNELPGVNLTDLPLLFEDENFRKIVKGRCRNRAAVDYWTRTLENTRGDWCIANITAYITSKFNAFVHSHVVRPIVGQAESTIRFNEIMNERKLLFVNLSKGRLGNYDARLLGMLVLGKLFSAALERANLPQNERAPFSVYVDEFQNFATDTAAHMLAEGRKFGLQMVLANQHLSQLAAHHGMEDVANAVLANVSSLLCFRLGPRDAQNLQSYFDSDFCPQDLQYLPDFHAAARVLLNGRPARPFVVATDPFPVSDPDAELCAAIEAARQRYTRPRDEVQKELALRCEYATYLA